MDGFVSIVGAGPWDPGLLTLRGRDRLRRADVVIADYLVNPDLLLYAPANAEIIERVAGPRGGTTLPQAEINRLMIERAQAGLRVVRLKGGDPCMFGRGGEEAEALAARGLAFEFVPGVSSPIAAPEAAGIPVTHRDHTPAVTFVSGFEAYNKAGLTVAWEHLARSAGTLVLMMSTKNARLNAQRLIESGRAPTTPAAVVRWGTRGIQRTVVAPLAGIADAAEHAGISAPAVLVVGDVVKLRDKIRWLEARPLFGQRVVITRPVDQASGLAEQLRDDGADVLSFPCLEIAPPSDPRALAAAVASPRDGVILTSVNGVRAFFEAIAAQDLDLRSLHGQELVAVGHATAAACRVRGIVPDIVPERARAEGIVDALTSRTRLGRRWLHIRAEEGRDVLRTPIEAAGGTYTLAIGYRTLRRPPAPMVVRSLLPRADGGEGFDAVCFSSGKTARYFLRNVDEQLGEGRGLALVRNAAVVAIGPVTRDELAGLGIVVAQTATAPTDAKTVEAVHKALASNPT